MPMETHGLAAKMIAKMPKSLATAKVRLAAETGARAGELFALTVVDVLFEGRVIRINKSMYKQQVQTPKSKNATRWVIVRADVVAMLRKHLNGKTSGLIFQTRKGNSTQ